MDRPSMIEQQSSISHSLEDSAFGEDIIKSPGEDLNEIEELAEDSIS